MKGIDDEINVIIKEINGPSWRPSKKIENIDLSKKRDSDNNKQNINESELIKSNSDSIKAVALIESLFETQLMELTL